MRTSNKDVNSCDATAVNTAHDDKLAQRSQYEQKPTSFKKIEEWRMNQSMNEARLVRWKFL